MSEKTIIGLDYDGTITRDPDMWHAVMKMMQAHGHEVHIVTMRHGVESTMGHAPMEQRFLDGADGVHFTGNATTGDRDAKRPHMDAKGIEVHVWIDDNPKAVHMSAREIWGWCTQPGDPMIHSAPELVTAPAPSPAAQELHKTAGDAGASPATDPAAVVGVEASERDSFEDYVQRNQGNFIRHAHDESRYASATVQGWWNAWKSRSALATPSQALPVAAGEAVAWQVKQKVNLDRGPWVDVDRATYEAAAKYPDRCEVRALYAGSPPTAREPLTAEQRENILTLAGAVCDGGMSPDDFGLEIIDQVESAHGIVAAPTGGADHG